MSIKTRTIQHGRVAIFELKGSLVGNEETDLLRASVADFLEQGNKYLVINLQKVHYVNSSGIGAIIAAHASYRNSGGEVRLTGIGPHVRNLLAVTRLVDVFEVFESEEEAIASFMDGKSIP